MNNRLYTPACDLLGCQYPVVLAGMGGVARSELVTAVTNAGGYGFLGMVREPPELIKAEIQRVRAGTDREFGVNVIPAATRPELLDRQINVCIEQKVSSVCLFWDVDPLVIRQLRDAGIIVVHQVGSVRDAEEAEAAGAHLLIVQGVEAGGHVRSTVPLRELLQSVLDSVRLPVLAAGGIVDGQDLVELLRLGAYGVVMGTAFLATNESFAHDYHKQQIIRAKQDDTVLTRLFHINWPFGAITRVLPNSITRNNPEPYAAREEDRKVIGEDSGKPVYLYSTDSPLRSTSGELEAMAIFAGRGTCRINSIVPAADRLYSIVAEAGRCLSNNATGEIEVVENELSSSPCYSQEVISENTVLTTDGETLKFLQELLAAERAGARVTLRSMLESENEDYRKLFSQIYSDEARWCRMLVAWIRRLGAEPTIEIGPFYHKAMAISDQAERLDFLNRGQAWVAKKIRSMSPGISITQLQEDLQDMLTNHIANFILAKKLGD